MRLVYLIVVLAATGVAMIGCGSAGGATESVEELPPPLGQLPQVRVTLDGQAGPANVAILMAIQRGFFTENGMEVLEATPLSPSRPVQYTSGPTADFGVTQQPQVPIARENGAPVVAVGSLVSRPTAAMIWLAKSEIRGISDLRGKTIAIPGIPYEVGLLESILRRAGLSLRDVKLQRVGYELAPALLSGRADAIFGGSWNLEGIALRKRGANPVIRKVQELGVPDYEELVMITRADRAAKEPKMVRNFMAAVVRGAAAAMEDPEGAVRLIEENNERNLEATPAITRAQVEATLPLLSQTGEMDSEKAADLVAWMHEEEIIQGRPPIPQLFTNAYLAQP
jgi:putative hydroxymethylpyrimidine transport system substrate-binding protein